VNVLDLKITKFTEKQHQEDFKNRERIGFKNNKQ
jgi:hypothetical protein